MRKKLANLRYLRFIIIPLLKKFNFEFKWKHDLTKRPFYLQSFYHKGYWFFGHIREKEELKYFQKLIVKGGNVLEVGAHIGYLTQYFEDLVGFSGRVLTVEPTPLSLYYLKKNIRPDTIVIEKAASDKCGKVELFIEEFGGFTNSIIAEYTHSRNAIHQKFQNVASDITSITVETDTLDNICSQNSFVPNFIKIDVEGAEYDVLKGAKSILNETDALMIEVSRNREKVFTLLTELGFKRIDMLIESSNYFFVKE